MITREALTVMIEEWLAGSSQHVGQLSERILEYIAVDQGRYQADADQAAFVAAQETIEAAKWPSEEAMAKMRLDFERLNRAQAKAPVSVVDAWDMGQWVGMRNTLQSLGLLDAVQGGDT